MSAEIREKLLCAKNHVIYDIQSDQDLDNTKYKLRTKYWCLSI